MIELQISTVAVGVSKMLAVLYSVSISLIKFSSASSLSYTVRSIGR